MNTLTTQSQAGMTTALGAGASNEMRALASWEVDDVSGGNTLYIIGGILFVGLMCVNFGDEIIEGSEKLAEWIRG